MRRIRTASNSSLALAVVLLWSPAPASAQEVTLVAPDAKEVAKGYRAEELDAQSGRQ